MNQLLLVSRESRTPLIRHLGGVRVPLIIISWENKDLNNDCLGGDDYHKIVSRYLPNYMHVHCMLLAIAM